MQSREAVVLNQGVSTQDAVPGGELVRAAAPRLTFIETSLGFTAAALHPWSVPLGGGERTFGHYLAVASVLTTGQIYFESHTDQRDERKGTGVSEYYSCIRAMCPVLMQDGETIGVSRHENSMPIEETAKEFWRIHDTQGLFTSAMRRIRDARRADDVFRLYNRDLRFIAMGVASRHNFASPAAQEAFDLLRAGHLGIAAPPRNRCSGTKSNHQPSIEVSSSQ